MNLDFLTKVFDIIPRFVTVAPDEAGVWIRMGQLKRVCEPGIYCQLPIIDDMHILRVTPQSVDIPDQSITTADGVTILVSGVIEYSIDQPFRAAYYILDLDKKLVTHAQKVILHYLAKQDWKTLDIEEAVAEIQDRIELLTANWGIDIMDFGFNTLCVHRVLRVSGIQGQQGPCEAA